MTLNITNSNYSDEELIRGLVNQIDAYIDMYHGGSVEFISFKNNILTVKLGGACESCSLKTATLKGWVEGTVKQFFPDIDCVEMTE